MSVGTLNEVRFVGIDISIAISFGWPVEKKTIHRQIYNLAQKDQNSFSGADVYCILLYTKEVVVELIIIYYQANGCSVGRKVYQPAPALPGQETQKSQKWLQK